MLHPIFKFVILSVFLSVLISCGGGSGGGDEDDPNNMVGVQPPNNPQEFTLNSNNYVAMASALYVGSVAVSVLQVGKEELRLFVLGMNQSGNKVNECSNQGIATDVYTRSNDEASLSIGDNILTTSEACDNSGALVDGTESTLIRQLSGNYPSGDYTMTIESEMDQTYSLSNYDYENGNYSYYLPITVASESNGDFKLTAIDLSFFHQGSTAQIGLDPFSEAIMMDTTRPQSRVTFLENPTSRFDHLAFELIEDNSADIRVETYQWDMAITNKDDADGSFSIRTIEKLVLEERSVIEDDGVERTVLVGVEGMFVMDVATGDRITVDVSEDLAVLPGVDPSVVLVQLDLGGDGSVDAQSSMTWDEFRMAFIVQAMLPSL